MTRKPRDPPATTEPAAKSEAERDAGVLGSLPRSRPHRRSGKRGASKPRAQTPAGPAPGDRAPRTPATPPTPATPRTPAATRERAPTRAPAAAPRSRGAPSATRRAAPLPQPPQPRGVPPGLRGRQSPAPTRNDAVATAVQAAAELAEIGLLAGARALRQAVSMLPRP